MIIKYLYIIISIIILIICYFLFWPILLPVSIFIVVLALFIYVFIADIGRDKIISKFEKKIYSWKYVNKNIEEIENWEYILNNNEKQIAKEVILKYKNNLKYIEEKDNKILIYPIKWLSTTQFLEWFLWKNKYIASYKDKKPIIEIWLNGILYNWNYLFEWKNIQWLEKKKGPFWWHYSPENNSSQALLINWFYTNKEWNIEKYGFDSTKIKTNKWLTLIWKEYMIYYELMWLPQTVNILIWIIENYMRKNNIKYWTKYF